MVKMPAEGKNYCIELNKNVCKTMQITTVYRNKPVGRSCDLPSFFNENIFFRALAEYHYYSAGFRLKIILWYS